MSKLKQLWLRFRHLVDLREYIDVDAGAVNIRDNIAFRGPNIVILFCAIIIASVGLNVNSIPVIIGAMLVSPLMSPILGFGLALGTNDVDLLWHSLKHLAVMVGISILSAAFYFLISPLAMENPTELLARTNPTIYDVLIALFGGLAGILEISRKEKGTVMSGVAIATALMPPLCTVGYGLATLQWKFFYGALYLFFINFTFIALASYIGTKYLGYHTIEIKDVQKRMRIKWLFGVLLIAIIVPSVMSAISVVKENNFTRSINSFVRENKNFGSSYIYDYQVDKTTTPATIHLYIAGEEPDTAAYNRLYLSAEHYDLKRSQLSLHLEAAYRAPEGIDENELMRNLFQSTEQMLQERNAEILRLHQQVDSLSGLLEQQQMPMDGIVAEIKAQYPQVEQVLIANTNGGEAVVVVTPVKHKALSKNDCQRMEAWLELRLQVSQAYIIVQEE